jgi:hypothetical protein
MLLNFFTVSSSDSCHPLSPFDLIYRDQLISLCLHPPFHVNRSGTRPLPQSSAPSNYDAVIEEFNQLFAFVEQICRVQGRID